MTLLSVIVATSATGGAVESTVTDVQVVPPLVVRSTVPVIVGVSWLFPIITQVVEVDHTALTYCIPLFALLYAVTLIAVHPPPVGNGDTLATTGVVAVVEVYPSPCMDADTAATAAVPVREEVRVDATVLTVVMV